MFRAPRTRLPQAGQLQSAARQPPAAWANDGSEILACCQRKPPARHFPLRHDRQKTQLELRHAGAGTVMGADSESQMARRRLVVVGASGEPHGAEAARVGVIACVVVRALAMGGGGGGGGR